MTVARIIKSLSGGGGVSQYATTFGLTENPISEGGKWVGGGTTGLDWRNLRTSGGLCFGTAASDQAADDCIAVLNTAVGISSRRHSAEGICHRVGGYTPGSSHEIEVILAATITAHSINAYELLAAIGATTIVLVRWIGAMGGFVQIATSSTITALAEGDKLRGNYTCAVGGSPNIGIYVNDSQCLDFNDTDTDKIQSGQPGLATFSRADAALVQTSYCWKDWQAMTI